MSESMIERVANVLTGHVCGQCKCSNESGWADAARNCACRQAARAAIEAMRNPPPDIINQHIGRSDTDFEGNWFSDESDKLEFWNDVIDAALSSAASEAGGSRRP